MRTQRRGSSAVLATVAAMLCCIEPARSEESSTSTYPPHPSATAEHVEFALARAGSNRPALEQVLAFFEERAGHKEAARYLIANMPWKGYIRTRLETDTGAHVAFDPLDYPTIKEAHAALEALEAKHGSLEFKRDGIAYDVEHMRTEFLCAHIEQAFTAWQRTPSHRRAAWIPFLEHVLPYRGSEEPLDSWLRPLVRRYAPQVKGKRAARSAAEMWKWIGKEVGPRVRFDERYYLHPTDQSFTEMGRTGLGRCEDITNMQTYAARAVGLAVAADYTPYWAHRDNNHAWPVLLDQDGRGSVKSNAHAAKVYRKTFTINREALAFHLPAGEEAPNRFMMSRTARDVTEQYRTCFDVRVAHTDIEADVPKGRIGYLCVFNGGAWRAIHWTRTKGGVATFDRMGGGIAYYPARFVDGGWRALGAPLILDASGNARALPGTGNATEVHLAAVKPEQQSVDTGEVTARSMLKLGETYTLSVWRGNDWHPLETFVADDAAHRVSGLPEDGLFWLTREGSRRLERIFTIERGLQRFW